jgi:uncharacterized Zn finger protein
MKKRRRRARIVEWFPFENTTEDRHRNRRKVDKMLRQDSDLRPVVIEGRVIAHSFWGKAWCDHLEKFSDYENRLPRGRTYARNGSVYHLEIGPGRVFARVRGSRLYEVSIEIAGLPAKRWEAVKRICTGQIGSLLDLLQGRLSDGVMQVVTDRDNGLFPGPREIGLSCTCPDWATMCKHVAATLYGVGARLDLSPELLFLLRGVNHEELVTVSAVEALEEMSTKGSGRRRIAREDLGDIFGIELAEAPVEAEAPRRKKVARRKVAPKKVARKKPARPQPITGASVARVRRRLKLTQAELAMVMEVSSATVARWEATPGRLRLQHRNEVMWRRLAESG